MHESLCAVKTQFGSNLLDGLNPSFYSIRCALRTVSERLAQPDSGDLDVRGNETAVPEGTTVGSPGFQSRATAESLTPAFETPSQGSPGPAEGRPYRRPFVPRGLRPAAMRLSASGVTPAEGCPRFSARG
jgi:hypothetical protein